MKYFIGVFLAIMLSGCATNNVYVVEERDIFSNFKEMSHLVCGGDYFYKDGKLTNKLQEELIKLVALNKTEESVDYLIQHSVCIQIAERVLISQNKRTLEQEEVEKVRTFIFSILDESKKKKEKKVDISKI